MIKKLFTTVLLALLLSAASARATELLVFGAASLTDVLQELAATYEKSTGDKLVFSFGASNASRASISPWATSTRTTRRPRPHLRRWSRAVRTGLLIRRWIGS